MLVKGCDLAFEHEFLSLAGLEGVYNEFVVLEVSVRDLGGLWGFSEEFEEMEFSFGFCFPMSFVFSIGESCLDI